MTATTNVPPAPATAAKRLAAAIVLLAAAFAVVSVVLTPDSLRSAAIRFVAIALTGVLVARGVRWARLLLIVLTGLAALYAAILAVARPMPLGWRAVFLVYGVGTVWCIVGLFREPAAAYFAARTPVAHGGA